jgi:hypothetical protein
MALKASYVHHADPQREGAANPAAFDWAGFGLDVGHLCRWAPGVSCMLGPLEAEAKARKAPAQRRQRQKLAAVVAPEEMDLVEGEDKQETDRNMEEMWEVGARGWAGPGGAGPGLGWAGLGRALGWAGLGWAGLGWAGLGRWRRRRRRRRRRSPRGQ